MKRLHVPIVGPTQATYDWFVKPVGPTGRADCSRTAHICQSSQCSPELTKGQWVMGHGSTNLRGSRVSTRDQLTHDYITVTAYYYRRYFSEQKYRYRIDFKRSLKWLRQVVRQATCRSRLSEGCRATIGLPTDVGWAGLACSSNDVDRQSAQMAASLVQIFPKNVSGFVRF